ncbi:hypothetical protein PGTUg99_029596 [Puccinia graminis f. sp. tritici]|uniref:Uncharacterized protein n=1 Tax=Puccinia graminis f. sp. tritici TaxID=56615 RepID=A0A5B0PP56_PUCGR|nr:hypothetical protein PGTUg99_029596 [Puccinia graminis f. sp. tritici]
MQPPTSGKPVEDLEISEAELFLPGAEASPIASIKAQVVDAVRVIITRLPKSSVHSPPPTPPQPIHFSRHGLTVSAWESLVKLHCPELLTLMCPSLFKNSRIDQSRLHTQMLHGVPKTTPTAHINLVKLAKHFEKPPPKHQLKFFRGICFALVASYPPHEYDLGQIPKWEREAFNLLLSWVNSIFKAIQHAKCTQRGIDDRPKLGSLASFLTSGTIGVMLGPEKEKAASPTAIAMLLNHCHTWYMDNPAIPNWSLWTNTDNLICTWLQLALDSPNLVTVKQEELAMSLAKDFVYSWVKQNNYELPWILQRGKKVPYVPLEHDYRPLLEQSIPF